MRTWLWFDASWTSFLLVEEPGKFGNGTDSVAGELQIAKRAIMIWWIKMLVFLHGWMVGKCLDAYLCWNRLDIWIWKLAWQLLVVWYFSSIGFDPKCWDSFVFALKKDSLQIFTLYMENLTERVLLSCLLKMVQLSPHLLWNFSCDCLCEGSWLVYVIWCPPNLWARMHLIHRRYFHFYSFFFFFGLQMNFFSI